ncbi:MAG: phage tail tape measure protein [Desulfocapsaceae bacterium]|nr:phage tail tape measure protein [Desulfocapsaceae bacterium]
MSDTMKLALELTAVDMMSGVLDRVRQHVISLGSAGEAVARDFDRMNSLITQGLKGVAISLYGIRQIAKGITPAADLQESMIDVRMSLMRSGLDAKVLNDELAKVRATAIDLQKITPFSAQDVVEVQKELLNSGLEFNNVVGKGATRAAVMLATITKESPQAAADAMLNVGIPYDLKSDEYAKVADVIQRHVMSGRLKLPDLNTNLKYVAGVAKNMKMPWDDLLTGMAVLGEQGMAQNSGIEMKDFLTRMTGSSREEKRIQAELNRYLKAHGKAPLQFWDKTGKLKELHTIILEMRAAFSGLTDEKKSLVLEKIFQQRGYLAAVALMKEGTGSWEYVKGKVGEVASAEDKMTERLKGFNAQVTALAGTAKTTLATMFDPMLAGLTKVTEKLNDVVAGAGNFAENHKTLTKGADYLAEGAVVATGVFGGYHLLKGGLAGRRVLKGVGGFKGLLKGVGGTALGVAEGKALQAASGVQPVFVTNWPSGGMMGSAVDTVVGAASGGFLSKMLAKGRMLGKGLATTAAALLPEAALVGGSGLAGYGIGTGLNRGLGWLSGLVSGGKYSGEGWLGEKIFDMTHKKDEVKNDIKLNISIDQQGRAVTKSSDPNTQSTVTMKRGDFADIPIL